MLLQFHRAAELSTPASAIPRATKALLAAGTVHPGTSTLTVVTKRSSMRAALLLAVATLRPVKFRATLVLRHFRTILLIHLWPILSLAQLLPVLPAVIGISKLCLIVLCTEIRCREV